MSSKIARDPRIDPRIKAAFGGFDLVVPPEVANRKELLAIESTPEADAASAGMNQFCDSMGTEALAPSAGLRTTKMQFTSSPDGNTVQIVLIRPDTAETLPCVYYIHGGGMMMMSCFNENYLAWARMIAANGVAVVMVDFRNALRPSSAPEVAPFPAGHNDCMSGLKWLVKEAASHGIDPKRILLAGESGGANLALGLTIKLGRTGDMNIIKGVYVLCPYILGKWPAPQAPSSTENEGLFISLHNNRGRMAYGIEAFDRRDPIAWPGFATVEDVRGFPPTVINVNECDPLRDEGILLYRLLLEAGVQARCRQIMGTTHGVEVFPACCPDISRDAAAHIAMVALVSS